MPDRQTQQAVLQSFSANKRKLKKLYQLYWSKFPQHGRLWKTLIDSKADQLEILDNFHEKLKDDRGNFLKLTAQAARIIDYIGAFIDQQLAKISFGRVKPKEALGVALSLEQSVMENKPLEIAWPLDSDLADYFAVSIRQSARQLKVLNQVFDQITD